MLRYFIREVGEVPCADPSMDFVMRFVREAEEDGRFNNRDNYVLVDLRNRNAQR